MTPEEFIRDLREMMSHVTEDSPWPNAIRRFIEFYDRSNEPFCTEDECGFNTIRHPDCDKRLAWGGTGCPKWSD